MAEGEITALLLAWSGGSKEAADALFPLVYEELRELARRQRRRRRSGETLNTTAVVHEAYVKLVEASRVTVRDREHFFALAARAMRQILVDHARRRLAAKRGGEAVHTGLDGQAGGDALRPLELLALDDALTKLDSVDARLGRIVALRFFAGLSVEETAELLALGERTVKRDWQKARLFLYREMQASASGEPAGT